MLCVWTIIAANNSIIQLFACVSTLVFKSQNHRPYDDVARAILSTCGVIYNDPISKDLVYIWACHTQLSPVILYGQDELS